MSILFSGPNDRKSFNEFTVAVPNPAEKIRNQGLEILKGLEKQSQKARNRSKEILRALEEKAQIESQFREKKFIADNEENRRIAKLYDNNARVNIQNKRTEAANIDRKTRAITELLGASGQFIQAASDITARRQERKDKEFKDTYNIQNYQDAQSHLAAIQIRKQFGKSTTALEGLRHELGKVENLGEAAIKFYTGASAEELEAAARAVARALGNSIPGLVDREIRKQTYTAPGNHTLGSATEAYRASNGEGSGARAVLTNVKDGFLQHVKETYGKNINERDWNRYVKPNYNRYWDNFYRETRPIHNKKAAEEIENSALRVQQLLLEEIDDSLGGPGNMFMDQKERWSQFLYKTLIEAKPKEYTAKTWRQVVKGRMQKAIMKGQIASDAVYDMISAPVVNRLVKKDPAGKQGDGTWGKRGNMQPFFEDLLETSKQKRNAIGKELKQEHQLLQTAQKQEIIEWDRTYAKLKPNRHQILKELSALVQAGGKQHLVKHIAAIYSIQANPSAINKELAKHNILRLKAQGILLSRDIARLTKHLGDVDRAEILKWHEDNGGDGNSELAKLIIDHKTEGENRIKRGGKWFNQLGGKNLVHGSVNTKIAEFNTNYDERLLEFLPEAALKLENKTMSPEMRRKKTLLLAAQMAFDAFNEEWIESNKPGGDGKYTTQMNKLEPDLKEYKYSHFGEHLPQGESYYTSDTLNEIRAAVTENPDAFKDPTVDNFVATSELRNIVHALNRGEAFRPTQAMKSISNSMLNGDNVSLFLQELEKYQRNPDNPKLELNETGLNNSAFQYENEIQNHLPDPVKAVVGQDKTPSTEGTEVLYLHLTKGPNYWSNLQESSASYLAPTDWENIVNPFNEGIINPLETKEEVAP